MLLVVLGWIEEASEGFQKTEVVNAKDLEPCWLFHACNLSISMLIEYTSARESGSWLWGRLLKRVKAVKSSSKRVEGWGVL